MATFITLSRDNVNEMIHVNMDKVVSFERRPQMNYTVLVFEGEKSTTVTVSEDPGQIHEAIKRAKKS
jgi:hypothetical protein